MKTSSIGKWIAAALCIASVSTSHANYVDECVAHGVPIVRIGAPHAYKPVAEAIVGLAEQHAEAIAGWTTCPVWAFGTDYQVVDWIENAELDAGIVSAFAARLMDIEPGLDSSLHRATNEWPSVTGGLRTYEYWLTAIGATDTAAVLDRFIGDAINGNEPTVTRIVVESHLSTDFILLLDHIETRAKALGIDLDDAGDSLWSAVLDRLEFRLGQDLPIDDSGSVELHVQDQQSDRAVRLAKSSLPSSDLLVFDRRLQERLFDESFEPYEFDEYLNNWHDRFHPSADDERLGVLEHFIDENYHVVDAGFHHHRLFQFNLDEASRILRATNLGPTALVLTGGGVKAAYQTRLIDHLYGNDLFTNLPPQSEEDQKKATVIDYVIGTSGGALLGTFVSAIDSTDDLGLTDQLWKRDNGQRYVESDDIFPIVDVLRYLSLLVGAIVLVVMIRGFGSARDFIDWLRSGRPPHAESAASHVSSRSIPLLIMIAILGTMPFAVKYVVGQEALQHVPPISGIAFLACLMIAGIAYQRLIPVTRITIREFWPRGQALMLFGIGAVLVAGTIIFRRIQYDEIGPAAESPAWAVYTCCIGFILIVAAFARVLSTQVGTVAKVAAKTVSFGFVLLAGVPILATVILYLTGTTLFELTGTFWKNFLGWCALITLVLLVVAYTKIAPPIRRVLQPVLEFLAGKVGNGSSSQTPHRRGSVIYIFLAGFLWWNFVLAPGMYGNYTARTLFDSVYCESTADANCDIDNMDLQPSFQPVTPFVISATSLDKEAERYFVLHPDTYREGCSNELALNDIPKFNRILQTDPRWHEFRCNPSAKDVIDKVFASGSPFPVFPATKVTLDDTKELEEELLVDGGFAHNIPMEAASILGATSIIVLSSSPLNTEPVESNGVEVKWYGNLIANFNRLFPYLFERSQVEDAIRARDSIVIAMAPTYRGEDWPALTDFRGETVERMIREAERDLYRRLAVIESWGRPVCEIGGNAWHCDDLILER